MADKCPDCGSFRSLPRVLHIDPDNPKECDNDFHKGSDVIELEAPEAPVAPQPPQAPVGPQVLGNILPICPYCEADPIHLRSRAMQMGPFELMVVMCTNCRKALSVFAVGFNGPTPGQGMGMPRMPGGPRFTQ